MYPRVTQFETRDQLIRDEIRVRREREALRRPARMATSPALPRRIARKLRFA
jgi:hypothetical protein